MPFQATVYHVLIASPSDVDAERKAIPEVIHAWNSINAAHEKVVVLPVMWETHSTPEMGARPQAIITKQLVKDCDILIGAFWTRLGTPTGISESGTVEEIKEFRDAGKPVLLYFSSRPVVPDSIDREQYRRLKRFQSQCQSEGLVDTYSDLGELREKVARHITRVVRQLSAGTEIVSDSITTSAVTTEKATEADRELAVSINQFRSFARRYRTEWISERDSEPSNIDEGKRILLRLGSDLLEYQSLLDSRVDPKVIEKIEEVVRQTRVAQSHRVFMDGGTSYHAFWNLGDEILGKLGHVLEILH
jgi:hypothetical protein